MKTQQAKGISAVIATIMLLMITVSLIAVFYVFSSAITTQTTSSGSAQASQLTSQLSMCMQVDNIYKNYITLRNCGKGIIENKSLVVMMDDVVLGASTTTILEGNSSVVNISGLWQIPFGTHSLKISNGAAFAQNLVDVQLNRDGLAGSWNFDSVDSGNNTIDASGNGNSGKLYNYPCNPATCNLTAGKFNKGLQFDGANDYVATSSFPLSSSTNTLTFSFWTKNALLNQYQTLMSDASQSGTVGYLWLYREINNNNLIFQYANGIPNSAGFVNYFQGLDNTWIHTVIVADYNNKIISAYRNGVLFSTALMIGTPLFPSPNGPKYIGSYSTTIHYFNGTIDEVRIWNRALAPDETVVMKQVI